MSELESPEWSSPFYEEAEYLISVQTDPVEKAKMMSAAITEGMPLSVERLLHVIADIPDKDERSPWVITPYQQKGLLAAATLEALTEQHKFTDALPLLDFLATHSSLLFRDGVNSFLTHGYPGPYNDFIDFTVKEIKDIASYDPDSIRSTDEIVPSEIALQKQYLEVYLQGVAQFGARINEPGSEYSKMLMEISLLGQSQDETLWLQQRRMASFARAYALAGHLDLAGEWKDQLNNPAQKALACLDIMEASTDAEYIETLSSEVDQLALKILDLPPSDSYIDNPELVLREVALRRLALTAKQSFAEAEYALQVIGEPKDNFEDRQFRVYLEIYKKTGNNQARDYCTELLREGVLGSTDVIAEIGQADLLWKNELELPKLHNELVPIIAREVENIFENLAFGPLVAEFKDEEAILEDLTLRQHYRDQAYASLAKLLTKNGAHRAADYYLGKIDGLPEKIRCLVGMAHT